MDEDDQVGVLLDGAGFAEVRENRLALAAPLLRGAGELGQRDDRDSSSRDSALSEREMSLISWTRLSRYSGLRMSWR